MQTPTHPDDPQLAEADRLYLARDWAAAQALYETLAARDPAAAGAHALAVGIGHCRVERAAADALDGLALDTGDCPGSARRAAFVTKARHRALEMCADKDFVRASTLLRFLAHFDAALAETYALMAPGPAVAPPAPASAAGDPAFLAATGLSDEAVAAAKRRHAGRRVMIVLPRFLQRTHEVIDNMVRSATAFGLEACEFDTMPFRTAPDGYASAFLAAIVAFKPDVIVYGDLFENDPASYSPALAEQVIQVLELARATFGTRVVRYLADAWRTALRHGGDLYAGLGTCVDLVGHQYPCVLHLGTPDQRAAVFCYLTPCHLPVSTVPPGTIPRACFVGRFHEWAYARVIWWAECGRAGLPIDFRVQFPWETDALVDPPATDQEYADTMRAYAVSLSLVSRLNGTRIMPHRALETLRSGGLLLQESSTDTEYFLSPGRHFVTFDTLADLRARLPALVQDRPRWQALAEAGQHWVLKHFTGDYYWAGLLDALARREAAAGG